ncbi:MAG: hypothetical protein P8L66_04725 [Rhodospirillaceae bacterium]|nr:hypothetical protein [Rhodospirillaceae bacterium]
MDAQAGPSKSLFKARAQSRREFLSGGLALGFTGAAHADGAHAAFTVIEHNARAGTVEVIHRLMVLDLEIALTARTGQTIRLEDTPDIENLIASYLSNYFSLATADGRAIPLTWVGAELNIKDVLAYQDGHIESGLSGIVIANQMLTETHPSQINTVNVTFGGRTQTRMFTLGDAPQTVALT